MNILQIQDDLKNFSEEQLVNEMQMPSGSAPQYLVLSEMNRRKRVKADYEANQAQDQNTVAEEAIASAGVPQQGLGMMAQAMAPKSEGSLPQPMKMAAGGLMPFGMNITNTIMGKTQREEVEPFLDEVVDMAESRFEIDLPDVPMPRQGGIGNIMPQPMVQPPQQQPFRPQTPNVPSRPSPYPFPNVSIPMPNRGIGSKGGPRTRTPVGIGSGVNAFGTRMLAEGGVVKAANGLPLGMRNFNLGNIRPGAGFIGETGANKGYATFENPMFGGRALARLLNTYGSKYGIDNINDLVERYAPEGDNPRASIENYKKFLSTKTGLGSDEKFDLSKDKGKLMQAIFEFETGQDSPFSQDDINKMIKAAESDDEKEVRNILSKSKKDYGKDTGKANFMSAMASGNVNVDENKIDVGLQEALKKNPQYSELGDEFPTFTTSEKNQNMEGEFGKAGLDRPDLNFFQKMSRAMGGTKYAQPGEITFEPPYGQGLRSYDEDDEKMGDASKIPVNVGTDKEGKFIEETVSTGDPVDDAASLYAEDEEKREKARIKAEEAEKNKPLTLDEQLASMQEDLKKSRQQDKWLAIAQAGLSIMASDKPTLAGAIGEGAGAGLQAYRDAQERYNEGVIDVLNARAKLAKAKTSGFGVDDALNRVIGLSNTIAKLEEQRTKLVEFPSADNKKRIEAIDQELRQARQLRDKIQKTYTGIAPIQISKSELNASLGKG